MKIKLFQSTAVKTLSDQQKQELFVLHEDIDFYMNDFYQKHKKNIVKKDVRGLMSSTQKLKEKNVYALKEKEVKRIKIDMESLYSRMINITKGIVVKSISNKLLVALPNAKQWYVSKKIGHTSKNVKTVDIEGIIKGLEEEILDLKNVALKKKTEQIENYQKAHTFAIKHNLHHLQLRRAVNDVTLYAYDAENKLVDMDQEGVKFKGGIVVPSDAMEIAIFVPKKAIRTNKITSEDKLYITKDYYFIVNQKHYLKNPRQKR